MKKFVKITCLVLALCMVVGLLPPSTVAKAASAPSVSIVVECEDLAELTDPKIPASANASPVEDADASGGKSLLIAGTSTGAANTSDVKPAEDGGDGYFPKAGAYEIRVVTDPFAEEKQVDIWVRAKHSGTSNQGIYCSIDQGEYTRTNFKPGGQYKWVKLATATVEAGDALTVDIYHRSRNEYFDKIIITDDQSFSPVNRDDVPTYEPIAGWGEATITPISGHPRIYVTQETLPALKEKLRKDVYKDYLQSIQESANSVKASAYDRTGIDNGSESRPGHFISKT